MEDKCRVANPYRRPGSRSSQVLIGVVHRLRGRGAFRPLRSPLWGEQVISYVDPTHPSNPPHTPGVSQTPTRGNTRNFRQRRVRPGLGQTAPTATPTRASVSACPPVNSSPPKNIAPITRAKTNAMDRNSTATPAIVMRRGSREAMSRFSRLAGPGNRACARTTEGRHLRRGTGLRLRRSISDR